MTANVIQSWNTLQPQDLFYAYRKAKVDCFKFTDVKCISQKIATYEKNLSANLDDMLVRLKTGEISGLLLENLGECRLVPKKLSIASSNKKTMNDAHGFFSDPDRAFANLCEISTLKPEFRLIGDFPIEMHVLSALWINTVGHKFDEVLSRSAYGSRLRRYRSESGDETPVVGNYHIEAIGSFQPYFGPYKRWRENGLSAIRTELQADRSVIAISMDLTSFYHRIDPTFIADPLFLTAAGIHLSPWQIEFTSAFVGALHAWSNKVSIWLTERSCASNDAHIGGVPIGLSMARVIANALLVGLDRDIEQGLTPVYYGRYVDDMFLVLRDPGNLSNATELLKFIAARTSCFPPNAKGAKSDEILLSLPGGFQGKTTLFLQPSKQKIFFLNGQGGLDLLGNIESQIRSVSSERRMMPSPSRLELMASAKVLTAAGHPAEDADTLRKADGLAVRRLGWSIQLRSVEILARDLRPNDWIEERKKFYQFAHSHILRPDKILDHIDYLPRLLSIAVALMDWSDARKMVDGSLRAIEKLKEMGPRHQNLAVNGSGISGNTVSIWLSLHQTVLDLAADAIVRSLRWTQRNGGMRPLSDSAKELCKLVGLGQNVEEIKSLSLALRECDWARISYKDHLRRDAFQQRQMIDGESKLYGLYPHEEALKVFLQLSLEASRGSGASRVNSRCLRPSRELSEISLVPYLFPTRPYSTQEVSLFLPDECIFDGTKPDPARSWARYVRAVRGVWVKGTLVADAASSTADVFEGGAETQNPRVARLGSGKNGGKTLLGISSLLTTEESFQAAASGSSDISRARYGRIERLINQAITAFPRPTHLLLPELSLPERWLETVSSLLRQSGISLIAGLDYHSEKPDLIHSEAVLVLTDDRLGFPASVQIRQPKSIPAAGEEQRLLKTFGKSWPGRFMRIEKPVYMHNGLSFGVLVCSELQNVKHRLGFQGNVDCMMVLSWNQDLETFSALVESASLDVHAYVALVNNRMYGDSRVRMPAKENYGRDLCRVRGGKNEHVVVVELNIEGLRAFQSRAKRWPSEDDPYKPVPEGFKISGDRKTKPS